MNVWVQLVALTERNGESSGGPNEWETVNSVEHNYRLTLTSGIHLSDAPLTPSAVQQLKLCTA
jgi:hypothetical protein